MISSLLLNCSKTKFQPCFGKRVFSHMQKNLVQEFGLSYLKKQQALKRPLSPHLTIYKLSMAWGMSGLQRIAGTVMGGTLLIGGIGFATLPIDFTKFITTIQSLHLPKFITDVIKFIIAFPIVFYTLNEIRMLGFEIAKGTEILFMKRTGYLVLAFTFGICLFIIYNSKSKKLI